MFLCISSRRNFNFKDPKKGILLQQRKIQEQEVYVTVQA